MTYNNFTETKKTVLQEFKKTFDLWKSEMKYPKLIGLLSPYYNQYSLFKELFSDSKITVLDINSWNLNSQKKFKFDLISASLVFMYSPNPEKWFSNVFSSCNTFWIHDLINRSRSDSDILGPDGDLMRFSLSPDYISDFDNAYDLNEHRERIINFVKFEIRSSEHFLASIRGDLTNISSSNLDFNANFRDFLFKFKYFIKGNNKL
tara:strand:+ start:2169 stop:2783 length:615 start_codon:yes stop_codon:yes gene_type:complete